MQHLIFERYQPAADGSPADVLWDDWPIEIGEQEKRALVRQAGFDPTERVRLGILGQAWRTSSGRIHPKEALIVAPHLNFSSLNEPFAVSRENVQRSE